MGPTNKATDLFIATGLVAVITGGGSGLGLYAARALDANGAKAVYIIGRRKETLEGGAKTAVNGTIKPVTGDVTDKDSLKRIVDQIKSEQGYVNLLIANAGVGGPSHAASLPEKPSIKQFQDAVFEPGLDEYTKAAHVNNTAVFYTAVAFLELLDLGNKQRNVPQDSQILITSSIAGFNRHLASSFAYSTSKAAVNHLIKMLATFFAQNHFRIRVNGLAPGLYPSEMTAGKTDKLEGVKGLPGGAYEGAKVMEPGQSPSERTGSEEDIAGLVLFMTGRAGGYLNGEIMITDGGRLSQLPGTY